MNPESEIVFPCLWIDQKNLCSARWEKSSADISNRERASKIILVRSFVFFPRSFSVGFTTLKRFCGIIIYYSIFNIVEL